MATVVTTSRRNVDKSIKVIYNIQMKVSEDVLKIKGIPYVQKYPYKDLSRTTKDMTHLHAWRKRIGEAKAQQITQESANIGTVMHSSLEKHVKGKERKPGSNFIHQKAHTMANVIIDNGLTDVSEVWGSEISLLYPELYAGTTDLVGVYKGQPTIMDFKQARQLKKKEWVEEYFLQLVAYSEAHNKMYDTQIKSGRVFICTQDNRFQTFEIDNYDHWIGQWYAKLEQYYKSIL